MVSVGVRPEAAACFIDGFVKRPIPLRGQKIGVTRPSAPAVAVPLVIAAKTAAVKLLADKENQAGEYANGVGGAPEGSILHSFFLSAYQLMSSIAGFSYALISDIGRRRLT